MAPIDPGRAHAVGFAVAWHARAMVLGWGVLVPLGIIAARFFKVLPGQDWPRDLDNPVWWAAHRGCQYGSGILMLAGLALVWSGAGATALHARLGWGALMLAGVQFAGAWLRGSKGGPTAPAPDGSLRGDHYDMTPRRLVFEVVHKAAGYAALACAIAAILTGLWHANGPRWMWAVLLLWWSGLAVLTALLQRRGLALDTYQAIWGPDPRHPGNRRRPIGLGIRRRQG